MAGVGAWMFAVTVTTAGVTRAVPVTVGEKREVEAVITEGLTVTSGLGGREIKAPNQSVLALKSEVTEKLPVAVACGLTAEAQNKPLPSAI